MDSVPLEQQAEVLRTIEGWRLHRMMPKQAKALEAAERTLTALIVLRQRLQTADHENEAESDSMSEELLGVLGLPRS